MQNAGLPVSRSALGGTTPAPSAGSAFWLGNVLWLACVIGVGAFLVFVWRRNYNFLGDFYDYSIISAAAGWLQQGLKPYRDFTTPLQSLPIYTGYFAERLFGARYLSLGYANLVLGLGFFFAMLRLLRGRLPNALRLLVAAALCVATFFQHGIVWYNSLAMGLLCLSVTVAAVIFRRERIRVADAGVLGALLFLSSLTKLNFHLVALGTTGLMLLGHAWTRREQLARLSVVVGVVFAVGTLAGPLTEMLLNGCGPADWFDNVVRTPAGRAGRLGGLLDPRLYFGDVGNGVYPDNWSAGIYIKAMLVYAVVIFFLVVRDTSEPTAKNAPADVTSRCVAAAWLPLIFLFSVLLTITNVETQMLTSSLLLAGLVAVHVGYAPALSAWRRSALYAGAFILAALFLLAGGASAIRHSRLRFNESGVVGYHEAMGAGSQLSGYFSGVRFTDLAWRRLVKIEGIVEAEKLLRQPGKIYWGPGLEILNRAYGGEMRTRLPLWYHMGVTVRDVDAARIIAELRKADYEWIFSAWSSEMPKAVLDYVEKNYRQVGDNDVAVYRRVR